jgi:hypothetical protein
LDLATDSTGGTTFASIALDSSGYPEHSGVIVIPHIDEDYKISLYPTQTAADADTGAVFTIDNLTPLWGDSVLDLLMYTLNETGAVERTVTDRLYDLASISDFGAIGNGSANDTAEIDAAPTNTYVPFGDWLHDDTAFDFDKILWGPGTIVTSESLRRGHNIFRLAEAPTLSAGNSIAEFFDTMPTMFSYDVAVSGAATCGEPSSGYVQVDETHPIFYGAHFSSGHNESLTGAGGRTGWAIQRTRLQHSGLGDAFCQNYNVFVDNVDLSHTGIAGQTAGGLFNGQIIAGINDCYLNVFELNMLNSTDDGVTAYDVNTSAVLNFIRYAPTEGAGNVDNFWDGLRFQAKGDTKCDSMLFAASGDSGSGWTWTLDHTGNIGRCDIALKAEDRIYFDAEAVFDTTGTGDFALYAESKLQKYITYDAPTNFFRVINMGVYADGGLMANLGLGDTHSTINNGDVSFELSADGETLTAKSRVGGVEKSGPVATLSS